MEDTDKLECFGMSEASRQLRVSRLVESHAGVSGLSFRSRGRREEFCLEFHHGLMCARRESCSEAEGMAILRTGRAALTK